MRGILLALLVTAPVVAHARSWPVRSAPFDFSTRKPPPRAKSWILRVFDRLDGGAIHPAPIDGTRKLEDKAAPQTLRFVFPF